MKSSSIQQFLFILLSYSLNLTGHLVSCIGTYQRFQRILNLKNYACFDFNNLPAEGTVVSVRPCGSYNGDQKWDMIPVNGSIDNNTLNSYYYVCSFRNTTVCVAHSSSSNIMSLQDMKTTSTKNLLILTTKPNTKEGYIAGSLPNQCLQVDKSKKNWIVFAKCNDTIADQKIKFIPYSDFRPPAGEE